MTSSLVVKRCLFFFLVYGAGNFAWAESKRPAARKADCRAEPTCFSELRNALQIAKGDRQAALSLLVTLYDQYKDPRLLFNSGRLLHQLGRPGEAVVHYRKFLDSGIETDPEIVIKTRIYLEQAEREANAYVPSSSTIAASNPATGSESPSLNNRTDNQAVSGTEPKLQSRPIYKKAWFWGVVGGVVGAGVIAGVTAGVIAQKRAIPSGVEIYPISLSF